MMNIELAREAYENDDIRRALKLAIKAKVGVNTEQKAVMDKGLRCLRHKQFFESRYGDIKPFVQDAVTVLRTVLCIDNKDNTELNYGKVTVFSLMNTGTVFKIYKPKERFKEYRFIKLKATNKYKYNTYCLTSKRYMSVPDTSRCVPVCRDMEILRTLKGNEENKLWENCQHRT